MNLNEREKIQRKALLKSQSHGTLTSQHLGRRQENGGPGGAPAPEGRAPLWNLGPTIPRGAPGKIQGQNVLSNALCIQILMQ